MTITTPPLSIYQLWIVLRGISPLIWRRVLVPSETTLAHLHTLLQILFAWSDSLEAYQAFQPEAFDRRAINTQLHARPWPGGKGP
jgi:hypothetical protein